MPEGENVVALECCPDGLSGDGVAAGNDGTGESRRPRTTLATRRSCAGISALDPASGASNSGGSDDSPSSNESGHAEKPGPVAVDSVVHIRQLQKGAKMNDRGSRGGPGGGSGLSLRHVSPFNRCLMSLVLVGLSFGAIIHGLVLWHSIPLNPSNSRASFPGSNDLHGQSAAAMGVSKEVQSVGHAASGKQGSSIDGHVLPTNKTSLPRGVPMKLGMPGDSDILPNQPVWDASKWRDFQSIAPESAEWPNTVAICAIMKSEEPADVVEWLRYHRWIGIDKVFLRENGLSMPNALTAMLKPFVDDGFLDLGVLPGPKHPLQNRWYNRCSKPDMAGQHSWIAFVDLDEFIVVLDNGLASETPELKAVLRTFKGNAGLSLQWVIFGSSGHVQRPTPGGPLAHFHTCTGKLSYQMKCMANMYHATHHMMVGNTVHDCTYSLKDGGNVSYPPVTLSNGSPLRLYENTEMTNPTKDGKLGKSRTYRGHLDEDAYESLITPRHRLALFHYATRSLADYTSRKIRLPGGVYAHEYMTYGRKQKVDVKDAQVMAAFEHENGFDGTAPICDSAVQAGYADQCCRAGLM